MKEIYPLKGKRIWVAGHRGMVGQALLRRLESEDCELLTVGRNELDLMSASATEKWVQANKPDAVFLAAARVGGIWANKTYQAEFIHENLSIQNSVIHGSYKAGVSKLLFISTSCIYPKNSPQPMKEDYLLTGKLEESNEPYVVAKIAGMKMCEAYRRQYGCDFISVAPSNLYGPNDSFDDQNAHVLPALLSRIYRAHVNKSPDVTIWGTGNPRRECLYVDDMADALVHIMKVYSGEQTVNIGVGEDVSIRELAERIISVVGYEGGLKLDVSKPDGMMRKLLDVSKLKSLGWQSKVSLEEGLRLTLDWYIKNVFEGQSAA